MNVYYYEFPACRLGIVAESGFITEIFFVKEPDRNMAGRDFTGRDIIAAETPLIKDAHKQLDEYFNKKRKIFDLPLLPKGTEFQLAVWNALRTIPYGETRSYMDIAALIGNPKACRAVGMANNRNPVVIIIPCHRVIGRDKSLTGYGGGLEVKRFLLELENVIDTK